MKPSRPENIIFNASDENPMRQPSLEAQPRSIRLGMTKKEIKRQRFIRVAERRTGKVLRKLACLARCANRNYYTYEPSDVNKIFHAIEKELNRTEALFDPFGKKPEFKL